MEYSRISSTTSSKVDFALVRTLSKELDTGEAEAIALAVELKADRLLIDERLGRSAALRLGLKITGVLGILVAAKRNNLIQEVKKYNFYLLAGCFSNIKRRKKTGV